MCLGMLSTSLSHCRWVTLCHSWRKNSSSSALFDGLWPSIFLLITFQRFLMGFRSGNWAGRYGVLIWWSFIHTFTDLAVWHGALSCWKKHSSELGSIVRAKGSKFCTTVISGLLSAPKYKPHALNFLKIIIFNINKPHMSISRRCLPQHWNKLTLHRLKWISKLIQ